MISPELIEIFNKGARLAREGKSEEALAEFDKILNPSKERKDENKEKKIVITGEFLGVTMMRKAWILMDLERYEDAKKVFEDEVMEACLGQFEMGTLYDYFFAYGNTLGDLGDIKGMDDKLSRALGIASEKLGDRERCFQCWSNLLILGLKAKDWEYLEKESVNALTFAENTQDVVLRVKAAWHHALALNGLGRTLEAKEEAGVLLTFIKSIGVDEFGKEIEEFITSLGTKEDAKPSTKGKTKTKKGIKGKKKK